MNEYTRREEVRWTLISSMVLVLCIAPAVLLLVTAQGKLVPDAQAKMAAKIAADRVTQAQTCITYADHLEEEIDVFKNGAKAQHLNNDADAGAPKKPPPKGKQKDTEPEGSVVWKMAEPTQKLAAHLASCRVATEGLTGARADTAPIWDTVDKVAAIAPATKDSPQQIEAARSILKLVTDLPVVNVTHQLKDAEVQSKTLADQEQAKAEKAFLREPIPEGLIARRIAVGIGVGLSVIALLLSYLSVRVASMRRLATLAPLREAARQGQPGAHAAAILRLAASHNGGEPGLVMGGAVGGLAAAAALPADTDLFIAGVMGGLLIGLLLQWVYRLAMGATRWRARCAELADIEKPAIPIVLVLSGVNPGLEGPFIAFFNSLSPPDAAITVEKLAAQAEERILAAADARAP